MIILSYIFYSFGFFIFLNSFVNLLRFNKIYFVNEWVVKFKKVTEKKPSVSDFRSKDDLKIYRNKSLFLSIEFIWLCIGIFTNNWFIFLGILFLGFFMNTGLKKIKFTIIDKILSFIYLLIKCMIYLFLFINKFHLNIDIMKLITSFVS
jgi:hypothetical protein